MKKFTKFSIAMLAIVVVATVAGPKSASAAATLPALGAASSFSVLAQTAITDVPNSVISGNVGLNAAGTNYSGLTSAEVGGTIYDTNGTGPDGALAIIAPAVQTNALAAFTTDIPSQALTSNQGPVLDGLTLTPGVYDIGAGRLNGGVLTLDGPGVYIFRASSDFISSGSINLINGATACDVFWRVQTLATINGSSFAGTILAGTGVHFGANVTLNGSALAIGGDVTMISDTISGPSCAIAQSSGGSGSRSLYGTINVIKTVINDNGGKKVVADFPLAVNGNFVSSGVTNTFGASSDEAYKYKVTEKSDPQYAASFSGDCDANGIVLLNPNDVKTCIITNNDIGTAIVAAPVPPLIDVVKVPSPLALPAGPGLVTYTYTLRNTGIVPVSNITMLDDSCSPALVSGDTNNDSKLDVNETWIYKCYSTLSETHTNTVVATGMANNISAVAIANATVVVGSSVAAPLIHVTKVPDKLKLPAGGGLITYTEKITNPGTVDLSNIKISDDKCSPMKYAGGDNNHDYKIQPGETFTYTCQTKLTKTTMNTVVVSGEANGMTVRDLAVATVVVANAIPKLPNTGVAPTDNSLGIILLSGLLLLVVSASFVVAKKKGLI